MGTLLLAVMPLMAGPTHAQVIAPEVAARCDLVTNGGFEEGEALPTWWARFPKQDEHGNRHLRDSQEKHSGDWSGLLSSVTPHEPGKAGIQWNRYGIPVEGGSAIIASMWMKTTSDDPVGAGMHFYDENRGHLGFVRIDPNARPTEWTYVRETVRVPKGAMSMGYPLYGGDTGDTWFDDVAAIATPTVEAMQGTPEIDGKLGEGLWSDEQAIDSFVVHTGETLPTEKTRAWVAYDDEALYVAFDCPHAEGAKLKEDATEHDGDVWLDDSVEMFLDPHHMHEHYYQACVNSRGLVRDTQRMNTVWESGARAKVQKRADGWSCELAIPYDSLALTLDVGETWGINLVRNDRVNGETATWSLEGFHKPERFGNVKLMPDLTRYVRPSVVARVAEKELEHMRLVRELRSVRMPAAVREQVEASRLEATALMEQLRLIGKGAAEPEGGWQSARDMLAQVSAKLTEARGIAVMGLFGMGGGGGGFRLALGHSLQKIRRDGDVTDGLLAQEVKLEAARDEAESFQVVVVPGSEALEGVEVSAPPLKGPGGEIPLEWKRVEYVETAEPKYKTEYVGWWPDPLLPGGPFDVKADERQPLWFTAMVPPDAEPGNYTGSVTVTHAGQELTVPVELRVRNFTLPRPGTLSTAFGLYASFFSRWWYGNEPYREHLDLNDYARWCEWLGKYRLTPKNIAREYITVKPTADDVEVELGALQTTVAPFADTIWAPYSFCMHRLPTAPAIRKPDSKHTPEDAARITKAIKEEWDRQGLPKEAYIYGYDEPHPDEYPFLQEAYTKVREAVPDHPIMQTVGSPQPEALAGYVDIWCPLSSVLQSDFYKRRREAGDTLWTYVCCGPLPPNANFFIDQPATDHRVLFWQTWQAGATGFLYWGICIWDGPPSAASGEPHFPDVPIHMAEHTTYKSFKVNGDGMLVYPGPDVTPISSIRLECIRDGIEDYEYLALLKRLVEKALETRTRQHAAVREAEALLDVPDRISRTMTEYTKDPADLFERRKAVGDAIEALTELLGDD